MLLPLLFPLTPSALLRACFALLTSALRLVLCPGGIDYMNSLKKKPSKRQTQSPKGSNNETSNDSIPADVGGPKLRSNSGRSLSSIKTYHYQAQLMEQYTVAPNSLTDGL
jgi:hypothetical protein